MPLHATIIFLHSVKTILILFLISPKLYGKNSTHLNRQRCNYKLPCNEKQIFRSKQCFGTCNTIRDKTINVYLTIALYRNYLIASIFTSVAFVCVFLSLIYIPSKHKCEWEPSSIYNASFWTTTSIFILLLYIFSLCF